MNWYFKINLIKLAAAKSKIQRYSIADPSIKFFIHRYEESIPWDEVEKVKNSGGSVDSYIQEFITNKLLPSLNNKINKQSPDNNFMSPELITDKDVIHEIMITEEAHGLVPRGTYTPEQIKGGRDMILHDINNEKATQFNEWWKYMNEEEIYAQNPAFQYSVLKPMIDSSPPDKKNSSPPLNAEILAGIWDEINNKGVDQMNILKKYRKLSVKAEKERSEREGVEATEKGGRWIRIKGGKSIDPKELKENINRLKNLSQGTGWCTARGMADSYLPQGDFYLYIENDKAVVAIRCVGNKVSEIRGYDNQQKELDPYWQEVISFLSTTDLDYQDNTHYKELQDIYMMNVDLEEGTPEYHTVLKQIQTDHKNYLKLSDENKQKFEIFRKTAASGYGKELELALREIEDKVDEGSYLFKFDAFQEKYDNVPPEIKAELPEMQGRIIQVHKNAYNNNPNLFSEFSPEIQKAFSPEEQEQGWFNYVNIDPYHYNDNKIPEEIKARIPLAPLKAKWGELISNNIDHIDNMSKTILALFKPGEIENYVLKDFASFPAASSYGKLIKLERVEQFVNEGKIDRQKIIDVLANEIRRNPENTAWINRFPDKYKNEVMGHTNVQTIVDEGRKNYVLEDTGYFRGLPPETQNLLLQQHGEEIGQAFAKTLSKYVGMYHNFWESVPANVRPYLPFEIIDATAQFYANEINNNPNNREQIIKMISLDIQPFVFGKLSFNKRNWYKRAIYELV